MTIDELARMPYWNLISTFPFHERVCAHPDDATDIMHWVFWSQRRGGIQRVCAPGMTAMLDR